MDMPDPLLQDLLEGWKFVYNRLRPHSELVNEVPIGRYRELLEITPCQDNANGQCRLKQERAEVGEFLLISRSWN